MREYSTQMEAAKKGIITPEMKAVAEKEYMEPEKLRELVAQGVVAIPCKAHLDFSRGNRYGTPHQNQR